MLTPGCQRPRHTYKTLSSLSLPAISPRLAINENVSTSVSLLLHILLIDLHSETPTVSLVPLSNHAFPAIRIKKRQKKLTPSLDNQTQTIKTDYRKTFETPLTQGTKVYPGSPTSYFPGPPHPRMSPLR